MQPNSPIYKAQTIGNIEPIEYMIPYPSTQAIIEGQIIKYKNDDCSPKRVPGIKPNKIKHVYNFSIIV